MKEMQGDIHAASSKGPMQAKLATWDTLACSAGLADHKKVKTGAESVPFNDEVVSKVVAIMKKAGYRATIEYANLA